MKKLSELTYRSIKVLQFVVLSSFVLIVINTFIVLYLFPESIDKFVKLLAAIGPFMFPMLGFAFAGNPLKKLLENQQVNIKLKAINKEKGAVDEVFNQDR